MAKRKSFLDNPALQFISAQTQAETEAPATAPEAPVESAPPADVPMKRNPLYVETKSKRVQLLLQPSLYRRLKTQAEARDISVNELIHTTLEAHVHGE